MKNNLLIKLDNPRFLKILFFVCLVFCFGKTVVLANVPEFFQYGAEIGEFLAAIGYSYIVSYIFYVVALKVDRDNKRVNHKYVLKKIKQFYDEFIYLLKKMEEEAKSPLNDENDLRKILVSIDPRKQAPTNNIDAISSDRYLPIYEYFTWAQYILSKNNNMRRIYSQIVPFLSQIDVKLLDDINDVMDSSYFQVCEQRLCQDNCKNLSCIEKEFIDFKKNVHKLVAEASNEIYFEN